MEDTRTSVRLPPGWHERIAVLAAASRRSVHAEILWLIERGLQIEEPEDQPMTLQIDDNRITSPDTPHRAVRITKTAWVVTWLRRDHRLTRNQAITAMTIASTVGATERQLATPGGPVDKRDPIWPHIAGWAAELGLDGASAVLMTAEAPKWED